MGDRSSNNVKSDRVADILSSGAKDKHLIAALQNTYGTKDLVAILGEETAKGNYSAALKVFDALDLESAATIKARLYKMRALVGLGNKEALSAFFMRPDIPDKEYYLAKAQHLAAEKRYIEAAGLCDKCRQSQAGLGDAAALDLTSAYVKASCLTSNFMVTATEVSRKQALDSWFEVKYLLRSDQDHQYFELANKNIRLLSDQSAKPGL